MKIKAMKKGERFIGLSGNRIILENKNHEIRIITIEEDEEGLWINPDKEIIITYGNSIIEYGNADENFEIINF